MKLIGQKGVMKEPGRSLEILSGYDFEEDITIDNYGLDMDKPGVIDGNSAWPRSDVVLRGVVNNGAATIILVYRIYGTTTKHRIRLGDASRYTFDVPARQIVGALDGGPLGATIKLLYKDKIVVNGTRPRDIA